MLTAAIYFYDMNGTLIQEIDFDTYEEMDKVAFHQMIERLGAAKVTLTGYTHNHHSGYTETLYEKTSAKEPK